MEARAKQTLELVRKDPDLTIIQTANELGISRQKVERTITRLQNEDIISIEGSRRNGRWIINKGNKHS